MKHLFIVLVNLFVLSGFSQRKVEIFNSQKLNEKREIIISLPASYEKNPNKKYPLLILLDGDYLLTPVQGSLDYGLYWDDLPEVIIAAICQNKNKERDTDCTVDEVTGTLDGKGIAFYDFITLELIPYLEHDYRTTNFKIIAGHDTTAAFSNFYLYNDKPLFNAYISLSPELPVGMEEEVPEALSRLNQPIFYYLSSAGGDMKDMQERIIKMDNSIMTIKKENLNYKFEYFKDASHFSLVLHSLPSALYQIFAAAEPISLPEYSQKIVILQEGYVDYLKNKYNVIENSFGIKNPIRINDFKAIEAAIIENKAYNELDELAILADKNYPKSMLGDYFLATMFEKKGDNPRAVRYYMSGFNKDEIADLNKDMMFNKADELKKTYAKKPKIRGKVGQEKTIKEDPIEEPIEIEGSQPDIEGSQPQAPPIPEETPVIEEKK